jgi:membrane protease YdiL (CAAX protease family)
MKQLSSRNVASSRVLNVYQSILPTALHSPAAWLFAALYVIGMMVDAFQGGPSALVKPLAFLLCYILIILAVLALTAPSPAWEQPASHSRRLLWWQLGAVLLFYLLDIGYDFLLFGPLQAPQRSSPALFFWGNIVVLFFLNVGFPLLVMRLLRVPWGELGFGRGYRVWIVMGVSSLIPALVLVGQALSGRAISAIGHDALRSLLVAAFVEEVFYRGTLLTRLIRLVGTPWGIVLAALIFGVSHIAVNLFNGGNITAALAQAIVAQVAMGIVLAVLFVRTHNIWAGVVLHTLIDATGL